MTDMSRRDLIKMGLIGGVVGSISKIAQGGDKSGHLPTPSEIKGPFYPVVAQKDKDFDLTKVEGRNERAKGEIIIIEGAVLDTNDNPVQDATVEIWQANSAGRYNHPFDTNDSPLDPNFQGWAVVPSGNNGGFRFKTIFPGSYPASVNWTRPPHIHYKISKLGYTELVTQMYFPGHLLNNKDWLLNRKSPEERKLMIAKEPEVKPDIKTYLYNIFLEKI
jgi:protocatechuate 3,4-dioxygenase, beta subunit